ERAALAHFQVPAAGLQQAAERRLGGGLGEARARDDVGHGGASAEPTEGLQDAAVLGGFGGGLLGRAHVPSWPVVRSVGGGRSRAGVGEWYAGSAVGFGRRRPARRRARPAVP